MLHILFVLLKVIGIILAVALGIVIVSLLCILFVPVRYRVEAKKKEDIWIRGKVSWLFSIIYIKLLYYENKFGVQIRIFGYCFYDSDTEKKVGKKSLLRLKNKSNDENDNNKYKKRKDRIERKNCKDIKESKDTKNSKDSKKSQEIKKIQDTKKSKKFHKEKNNSHITIKPDLIKHETKNESDKKEVSSEIAKARLKENLSLNRIRNQENINIERTESSNDISKNSTSEFKKRTEETKIHVIEKIDKIDEKDDFIKEESEELKDSIIEKIKHLISKLKDRWKNLLDLSDKTKLFLRNIRCNFSKILNLIKDEGNKSGFFVGFNSLRKILKYLHPKKLKIYFKFGTGDPCSTGQILACIALYHPIYKSDVQVIPYFDEKVLELDLYALGRIRIISLLIISIKIIRDKDFKYLLNSIQKFKEEI